LNNGYMLTGMRNKIKLDKIVNEFTAPIAIMLVAIVGVYVLTISHAAPQSISSETTTNNSSGSKLCTLSQATGATSSVTYANTAIPNTGADQTTAIQASINNASAAGGGIVSLPAGTFIVDGHIIMKSNVKLIGAGPSTIIKAGPNFLETTDVHGGYPVIATDGASNVTISNLTADQSGNTLSGNSVSGRLTQYLIDVRDSTNVIVSKVSTINPFTYSIAAIGSTKFCIKNSNTQVSASNGYNQLDGIHVTDSTFGDINSNTVNQRENGTTDGDDALVVQTFSGQTVHDIKFANNIATGGYGGADFQFAESGTTDSEYNIYLYGNHLFNGVEGIHTGCYDSCGTFSNIVIGGSVNKGNEMYNNLAGINPYQHGDALNLAGSVSKTTFSNNIICDNGIDDDGTYTNLVSIPSGNGNVVEDNTTPTTCP